MAATTAWVATAAAASFTRLETALNAATESAPDAESAKLAGTVLLPTEAKGVWAKVTSPNTHYLIRLRRARTGM
jgi:hypothetical protein